MTRQSTPEQRMKRYLFSLVFICLLGIAAYQLIYPIDEQPSFNEVAENLNERNPMKKLEVTKYGQKLQLVLSSPKFRDFATNAQVEVIGKIGKLAQLGMPYVWMQVDYLGDKRGTFHYYLPVNKQGFSKKINLFAGKGEYQVTLRAPSAADKEQFFNLATFRVNNVNPAIQKDVEYSLNAVQEQLTVTTPNTGYQASSQTFQLTGKLAQQQNGKLLVQMKKDDQIWKRTIATSQGKFSENLPLLFGKGIHEIKVMLPSDQEGYFQDGATLYVDNQSPKSYKPIRYTHLYHQRGIQLVTPLISGDHADLKYRISGMIDKNAPYAKQTSHVIVQTVKGSDKATYFLPVNNYVFNDQISLRFGAGKYEVTLFVPDLTNKNRDFFRFYNVATFEVTSHAQKDARNLLPSRGIDPDHPRIQELTKRVIQGKKTKQQQAEAIYRYVATYMTYDMDKLRNDSFDWDDSDLKSLSTGKGVCQDYVFLALSMLRSAEIPSRFVEGEAGNQRHAWIEVYLGKRWVTMDPTWGSGYISGNTFVERFDPRYFDPKPQFFERTHHRTGVVY